MFFFFNDTATTEIYTLSLHDALPIFQSKGSMHPVNFSSGPLTVLQQEVISCRRCPRLVQYIGEIGPAAGTGRSEAHTAELQSPDHLVCPPLLEKKKTKAHKTTLDTDA